MGKRSDFERVPRDFYPTPYEAVVPLLAHLPENCSYAEPCAGDGALIKHLALQASGMETGTAETEGLGPKDDSPVGEAETPGKDHR